MEEERWKDGKWKERINTSSWYILYSWLLCLGTFTTDKLTVEHEELCSKGLFTSCANEAVRVVAHVALESENSAGQSVVARRACAVLNSKFREYEGPLGAFTVIIGNAAELNRL